MTGKMTISHAGFHVFDLPKMVDFYTDVVGLKVTDRSGDDRICFLSADPRDHHQMLMVRGRTSGKEDKHFNHIAFRVDSLSQVKDVYSRVKDHPEVSNVSPLTHGNAWSVYFNDPEGNRTEVFVDTPWHCQQPFAEPIDLDKTEEEIAEDTLALLAQETTQEKFAEWKARFRDEMGMSED